MKKNSDELVRSFHEAYAQLNAAQKKAVDTIEGPVIVVAGPGTGKTQILTLRIANILRNAGAGVAPENILALTFTNAGVNAMRIRLAGFIGAEDAYRVTICTFHGFCEEHINRYSDYFPEIAYARVASDIEKIDIVERILSEHDFGMLKTFASEHHYTKEILRAIDHLKREGITPNDFMERIDLQEQSILADGSSYYKRATKNSKKGDLKPEALSVVKKNRELQKVYHFYQIRLRESKLYDFSDMIMHVITAAEKNEEFASVLREQYQYILVDEHQDTNDGQNRIIEALTEQVHEGDSPNLFTVGDDKQAIYRFQGASVENFLRFEQKYPSATVIHLENNYRSAQGILDEAHALIKSGKSTKEHKELIAAKVDIAGIRVLCFHNYKDELITIAKEIKKKLQGGVVPSEIAVFYREHHNVTFIKEVFEKIGVPYDLAAKQDALQDRDMKKLLLLLKVVNDPFNDHDLASFMLTDLSNVDIDDATKIVSEYRHTSTVHSLYDLLRDEKKIGDICNSVISLQKVVAMRTLIKLHREMMQQKYIVEFFEDLVRASGFMKLILSREGHVSLLGKLNRIFDEVRDCAMQKDDCSVYDLVLHFETFKRYGLSLDAPRHLRGCGVQLMTAHGSKGLEFEHVYITNVVHGLWGGKRNSEKFRLPINSSNGDLEDERRLFYVAITRAKKDLTISFAKYDVAGKPKIPSLFIADLSADLVDMELVTENGYDIFFLPRMHDVASLISTDFIRERFLRTPLSATALNNYYDNPLKYFFRNLVRLPSVQNKTMIKGSVIHAALEKFFMLSKEQGEILPEDALIEVFEKMIMFMRVPREYVASIKKSGTEALRGYYKRYATEFVMEAEFEKKITGIPFFLPNGTEIILTGAIDKVERNADGTITVVDYKSGKPWSKKKPHEREALKRQVVFYKILLDRYRDRQYNMTDGVLDFIEPHPQTGDFERECVSVQNEDIVRVEKEIAVFAQEVLSGAFLEKEIICRYDDRSMKEYLDFLDILKG